jgi:hypothetical protein
MHVAKRVSGDRMLQRGATIWRFAAQTRSRGVLPRMPSPGSKMLIMGPTPSAHPLFQVLVAGIHRVDGHGIMLLKPE